MFDKLRLQNSVQAWLPAMGLACASFIFVTTEFIPVGLLPDLSQGLHRSEAFIGLLMTIYAWIVATMSLPMTVLTANWERRKLTLTLLGTFIVAHLIAGLAINFSMLLVSRIFVALTHSIFWSITTPLAVRVSPPGKKSKALAVIVVGASLGNILGIPLGTLLGHLFGWRLSFVAIAIGALVVTGVIYKTLPIHPSLNAGSLKSLPSLMKRPLLWKLYLITALTVTGNFALFTYINPFMQRLGGFSASEVVQLLLVFGCSGILGSLIGGRIVGRSAKISLVVSLIILCASLLLAKEALVSYFVFAVLILTWGTSMTVLALALQTTILSIASDAADIATSLYSGIFNIGIGAGALIGSLLSTQFLGWIGVAGAAFAAVSTTISLFLTFPPPEPRAEPLQVHL